MMKLTDWIVEKIGSDKLLHFLVAGFLTALVSPIGWIAMIAMTLIVAALDLIKEKYLDATFDWNDFYFTIGGSGFVLLFNLLLLVL